MPDKPLSPADIAANRALLMHLREWLTYRNVSQRAFAERLETSEASVSKWLKGTQAMTLAQFSKIAALLGASPSELLLAPPRRAKAERYERVGNVARDMPDDALEEWLALGRRLTGKPAAD
jgi:transcriptional regulator with XRE-family HTH domain